MNRRKWTDKQFVSAAKKYYSIRAILKELGLNPTGANYKSMWAAVKRLKIDVSHWTGQAHLRGKTHDWGKSIPFSEVLIENSNYHGSSSWLKDRLIRAGILRNECYECGQETNWKGKKLVMVLDHRNGINTDHRKENLRLLCPNCNSQSDTFAGRNIGKMLR
jgi:hypothetical protein